MSDAIQAEGLVKRFGETTALAGADLEARTGSVLAVLGPNGAGKTTAVRSSPPSCSPTPGAPRSPATTWSRRPTRCGS
jgi:oleandomycin transport system ATP-binding protein